MTRFSISPFRLLRIPSFFFILFISSSSNAQGVLPPERVNVIFENITGYNPFADPNNIDFNSMLSLTRKVKAVVMLPDFPGIGRINLKLFDNTDQLLVDGYSGLSFQGGLQNQIIEGVVFVDFGDFSNTGYGGRIECNLQTDSGDISETIGIFW